MTSQEPASKANEGLIDKVFPDIFAIIGLGDKRKLRSPQYDWSECVVPIESSKLMSIETGTPTIVVRFARDRDFKVVVVQSLTTVS